MLGLSTPSLRHPSSAMSLGIRLLVRNGVDEYKLTRFDENEAPPYAILSHTWLAEEEEPNFQDLINRTGKKKLGYDKLRFCGDQAGRDNLRHFWVDTCCIDKSKKGELFYSINSMFQWYRRAARCYVHLWDVSTTGHTAYLLPDRSRPTVPS